MIKSPITHLHSISLLCFLLLFSTFAFAQLTITGKVTDESNKPLDGVTVQVEGTATATQTKADGTYQIKVPSATSELQFSSVGHVNQKLKINNRTQINVALLPTESSMQSVVVVGYGTRKKSDVTGAVASITGEKMRSVPTTNLTQALQGRIPGVDVTPSGFRPGQGSSIRVRGNRSLSASNEPLYVVDGFPVSYTIDDMNPADIESIDVLKDASATAIYGVRGANGVIQITTRKGKAGKVSVNYQGSQSIEEILKPVEVLSGSKLADAWRQSHFDDTLYTASLGKPSASNPLYYYPSALADVALFYKRFGSLEQWNAIKDAYSWRVYDLATNTFIAQKRATTPEERALMQSLGITSQLDSVDIYDPSKIKNYDWPGNIGIRRGQTSMHSISVTAGAEKVKASFNAGYMKQKGIEYAQDYTRYTAGSSADFTPNKHVNFGATINFINTISNTSTGSYGNALGMIPFVEPYDSAGNWIVAPNKDDQIISAVNDRNTVEDNTVANRVFGNIYGELTFFKGLKYRTLFGLDNRTATQGKFNGAQSSVRRGSAASASKTVGKATSWVYDNILTYNTTIKSDHTINVTLLQELQSLNRSDSVTLSANNLIFESQKWYSLQQNSDATVTGTGSYSASQYLSYMGRLEYGFKGRYNFTVSSRYDNSSVLSENNRGAWFHSGSVAWQMDKEEFFGGQHIINMARLRAGIGQVGNASIGPYQTGGPLAATNYNWGNGTAAIGQAPRTFQTPTLGWEKTTTINVGLEFGVLKSRISGSVDLYKANTTDQLQNKFIPSANGVTQVYVNLGEIENKGIEVSLNTQNISRESFRWSTDFIFTKNKEKIVNIDGTGNSNYANLWILGQPIQVYWGYKSEGIFQYSDTTGKGVLAGYYWLKPGNKARRQDQNLYRPGRVRIADTNHDTLMSPADRVVLGSHNPDFTASVGNTISYKNLDLNFLVYIRVGGLYRVPRPGLVGRYQTFDVNYWTPSNPSNEYWQPSANYGDIPFGWEAQTYTKATFAKVRNITLTYRVPKNLARKASLNSFSVYISAVNPILIHNHSTYDPETVPYKEFAGSTTNNTGPSSYSYRSYVLGVKLDL